jgi:hypothetical protein
MLLEIYEQPELVFESLIGIKDLRDSKNGIIHAIH